MFKSVATFCACAAAISLGAMFMDHKTAPQDGPAVNAAVAVEKSGTGERITAISANRNGQFSAAALVNGVHVDMLADTGATLVVLSDKDAQRIGLDPGWLDFDTKIRTANGVSLAASVVLDEVEVGGIRVRDVKALVSQPGALDTSLLGMSFIGKISRFELRGDQLVLVD